MAVTATPATVQQPQLVAVTATPVTVAVIITPATAGTAASTVREAGGSAPPPPSNTVSRGSTNIFLMYYLKVKLEQDNFKPN